MPYKDPAQQKAYQAEHHRLHARTIAEKKALRRRAVQSWLIEIKSTTPCADCGVQYPYYVMHFDHLGDKLANISRAKKQWGRERVEQEVAKCDVVCANCHAARSFERGQHLTPIV